MWPFRRKAQIRAVLFDIGGVVVEADLERYLDYGAEIFGTPPEDLRRTAVSLVLDLETGRVDSLKFWDLLGQELERRGLGKNVPAHKFRGFWEGILRDTVKVDMEMMNIVSRVARNVRVGVLSNTIEEHAAYLTRKGVYKPFSQCILSYQVGMRKPDEEIYRLAAERMGVGVRDCYFIDDSLTNIKAAQALGMKAHHYTEREALWIELSRLGLL